MGAPERRAAAIADRLVHFQRSLYRSLPGTANTGTPLASFLIGQVQQFSIDLQQEQIRNRASFQEILHPGRLAHIRSRDDQRWSPLSSNISIEAAYVGSKYHPDVGIPDSNLNQLTVEQLAMGSALTQFGAGRARQPGGVIGALVNDWTLSGIVTLQSGIPIAVTQATNSNAFAGFGTQRPNLSGDPALPADERSAARWFNTAAFSLAPQFPPGNASRNPVRGPGYRNLDLALVRRVPLPAGNAIELRAEGFNITNTTPFGAPNGSFGSAAFGTITTAAIDA